MPFLGLQNRNVSLRRPKGYSIYLIFLRLFGRIYAPLMAGLLSPVQRVADDLDTLIRAVGHESRMTPASNENKIPIRATITA